MKKDTFHYRFNNGETHFMTAVEAHRYATRKFLKIVSGPGFQDGRRKERFTGWGYHDSLQRTFKGPNDYRTYLRANGLVECGDLSAPQFTEPDPPVWDDEMLKKASDLGIQIGSVLAEALKSGEVLFPEQAHIVHGEGN